MLNYLNAVDVTMVWYDVWLQLDPCFVHVIVGCSLCNDNVAAWRKGTKLVGRIYSTIFQTRHDFDVTTQTLAKNKKCIIQGG